MARNRLKRFFDSVNGTNWAGTHSKLQQAVVEGSFKKVTALIEKKADISYRPDIGVPNAVMLSLMNNECDIFHHLIANLPEDYDVNDVMLAVHGGRRPGNLLSYLASERVPRYISYNSEEIIALLIQKGADPLFPMPKQSYVDGLTPMHLAIDNGRDRVVDSFLKKPGLDLMRKHDGETLLHYAWKQNKGSIFKSLLEAEPNLINVRKEHSGETLMLDIAEKSGYDTLSHVLRHSKPDMSVQDAEGNGVLHKLLANPVLTLSQKKLMIGQFVRHGADVTKTNYGGISITHLLAYSGGEAGMNLLSTVLPYLKKLGAKAINQQDDQGRSAIYLAAVYGEKDGKGQSEESKKIFRYMVDILIEAGADVNTPDVAGYTILDRLAERDERDSLLVQRLLKSGAQYDKFYSPEEMAEHRAMLKGSHVPGKRKNPAPSGFTLNPHKKKPPTR